MKEIAIRKDVDVEGVLMQSGMELGEALSDKLIGGRVGFGCNLPEIIALIDVGRKGHQNLFVKIKIQQPCMKNIVENAWGDGKLMAVKADACGFQQQL